jgi:hypothetical protein
MPENQMDQWRQNQSPAERPLPSLTNAFPEETEVESEDTAAIAPPTPIANHDYIQPAAVQPYANIPMAPEVYREHGVVIPTANESAPAISSPRPDDLVLDIPPRKTPNDNWLDKPQEIKPMATAIDPDETWRRLGLDQHTGEKEKSLKQRVRELITTIKEQLGLLETLVDEADKDKVGP